MSTHESKTFWYCVPTEGWPSWLDIFFYIFEIGGLLMNAWVAVYLFKAQSPLRLSLILLRIIVVNCFLAALVNFLDDLYPWSWSTDNYIFNVLFCIFWNSRFFYWIFVVTASQSLTLFAFNQALTVWNLEKYRLSSPERRLHFYLIYIFTFSICITLPQFLTVNLDGDKCSCAPTAVNIPFLAAIYAHTYMWFSLLLVLSSAIMITSSVLIVLWKRNCATRDIHLQHDELNLFRFSDTSQKDLETMCSNMGWNTTGAMVIVYLSASYVVTFSYDASYQFLSALGVTTFIVNSDKQKAGAVMIVSHTFFVPCLLLYFIPIFRKRLHDCFHCARLNPQQINC